MKPICLQIHDNIIDIKINRDKKTIEVDRSTHIGDLSHFFLNELINDQELQRKILSMNLLYEVKLANDQQYFDKQSKETQRFILKKSYTSPELNEVFILSTLCIKINNMYYYFLPKNHLEEISNDDYISKLIGYFDKIFNGDLNSLKFSREGYYSVVDSILWYEIQNINSITDFLKINKEKKEISFIGAKYLNHCYRIIDFDINISRSLLIILLFLSSRVNKPFYFNSKLFYIKML